MVMKMIPIKQTTVGADGTQTETTVQAGLLLPAAKEGRCSVCFSEHEPELPHNPTSLPYQYAFYAEKGRWADWRDAMADCSDEVRAHWTAALTDMGVDIEAGQLSPKRS